MSEIMWAEYGARVIVRDERYPGDVRGTIVSDSLDGIWTVDLDGIGPDRFSVERLVIKQTPSVSAYLLTQRHSVDEVLSTFVDLAEVMDVYSAAYRSAIVFELYRLNYYAEQQVAADSIAICLAEVGPDEYGADEYPVYRDDV
jgi:hypothetical protein